MANAPKPCNVLIYMANVDYHFEIKMYLCARKPINNNDYGTTD